MCASERCSLAGVGGNGLLEFPCVSDLRSVARSSVVRQGQWPRHGYKSIKQGGGDLKRLRPSPGHLFSQQAPHIPSVGWLPLVKREH